MAGLLLGFAPYNSPVGDEVAQIDTNASAGNPTSGIMASMMLSGMQPNNFKNFVVGGEFGINPWQRGTTSGTITSTLTYTADKWWALTGASSAVVVSKQAITDLVRHSSAARVQRTAANADLTAIQFGTIWRTADSYKLQGRTVALSFWAKAGANFSPANGTVTPVIATGTGTDGSAATLAAGTWTGYAAATLNTATAAPVSATPAGQGSSTGVYEAVVLTATPTFAATTTRTRYQFTATIPAAATQVGLYFTWTPVGTAGANDWIEFEGVQLEAVSAYSPWATNFEHRAAATELLLCQRSCVQFQEVITAPMATGMMSATNVQTVVLPLPVTMDAVPTVTVSAGTLQFNIAGTPTAVGGGFAAGTYQTTRTATVVGAVTATVGQATYLMGGAGATGYVRASSDL